MTPLLAGAPQAVIREFSQQRAQRGRYVSAASATAATVSRSLRFNSADSAYLSRTPASAGNRKTWTLSLWLKRTKLGDFEVLFGAGDASSEPNFDIDFGAGGGDNLRIRMTTGGGTQEFQLKTTQVFRDVSSWYHIVVAFDTTQATASNRIKLYVNGSQVTAFSTEIYPSQNLDTWINATTYQHVFGRLGAYSAYYFNGYLANIHFIDGYAYDPSYFGETNATTGVWDPKTYTGSYGSQGWFLNLADNSSTTSGSNTGIGKDTSGNGNYWNSNNLSVTAGSGNDSLIDTPTNGSQTDTGLGGEVVGNYCTFNPLDLLSGATTSDGNLFWTTVNAGGCTRGTLGVSSGKWYFEFTYIQKPSGGGTAFGVLDMSSTLAFVGNQAKGYSYYSEGAGYTKKVNNNVQTDYGASFAVNDIIGVALDLDAGTITFYKNGSSQGQAFSGLSGTFAPAVASGTGTGTAQAYLNAGARAFAYTAPSGFKALCTANLPAPTIGIGNTAMDVKLYTGNGSTQTISGLNFSPEFVWMKSRSAVFSHHLVDVIRGGTKVVVTDSTATEYTSSNYITSFDSTGFSIGNETGINNNGTTYAAWAWDAGSSTVSNTQGSITSTVRANASAGFSIISITAPSSRGDYTVGHGLGAEPHFAIWKNRSSQSATGYWGIYHKSVMTDVKKYLSFDTGGLATSATNMLGASLSNWNSTTLGISIRDDRIDQNSTGIIYAWTPVTGYSAFGSYTGNGSTDGPFVYTGFRPRWVLIKGYDASNDNWKIYDTSRSSFNVMGDFLAPNDKIAEVTANTNSMDMLANGFKMRSPGDTDSNYSGYRYIYIAFAESPINYSRAR